MKTAEILTISELMAQYAATDYVSNPKYYQVWFEEELIGWQGLELWFNTQDAEREVAVFEDIERKVLSIKKLRQGHS